MNPYGGDAAAAGISIPFTKDERLKFLSAWLELGIVSTLLGVFVVIIAIIARGRISMLPGLVFLARARARARGC